MSVPWIAALSLAMAWHGGPRAEVQLRLPAEREVAPGTVRLGDVAEASGDDLAQLARLVHLPLGPAPRPGQAALLTREQLAAAILRQVGPVPGLRWEGAASSRVSVAAAALAVHRGQWAQMRAGAGPVEAALRVEVLQDGRAGDRVLVRHAAGGPAVRGLVVAPGVLEPMP